MTDYKTDDAKTEKRKQRKAIVALLALVFFIVLIILTKKNNDLNKTAKMEAEGLIVRQLEENIRIVLITDLHNVEFGDNNHNLITPIKIAEPDIICMAGDMLNGDETKTDIIENLIRQCVEIAPVYYSYGNHEVEYEEYCDTQLRPVLEQAGAVVLEQEYIDVLINGQLVRIGGLFGYAMPTQVGFDGPEQRYLEEFQDTDHYKILLCHMPAAWIQWNSMQYWDIDLVLAGHTHGGQVKVPFLGGVYAPDQGWFPDFTSGRLEAFETTLIVSSGLGSEGRIPRINNQPEVIVIELMAEE